MFNHQKKTVTMFIIGFHQEFLDASPSSRSKIRNRTGADWGFLVE
jgi:hypothetical protein